MMKFNNKNITIGKNVTIGKDVKIGDNVTIYDNVSIGDGTIICNDCVLGEPLNDYYHNPDYSQPKLIIGKDCLIRSHSIFYAGSEIGDGVQTGHRVTVRENTKMGNDCSVGSYCDIQGFCEIGNNVRMQSYVNIGQGSTIEDCVFLYPFTVLTNDPTPPSNTMKGVTIKKFSVISTNTTMLPGAYIGENCLIAAQSLVGGKFEDFSFISGSPARRVCDLRKAPFFDEETGKRHYPWQTKFKRGMPWQEIGFDEWEKQQNNSVN